MSGVIRSGPLTWLLDIDDEGHREYKVSHIVEATSVQDGPFTVAATAGLPVTGAIWNFGNDLDAWAYCKRKKGVSILQEKEGDANRWWRVDNYFSTRPQDRCQDDEIEDPLLEPQRISGSFVKYTRQAAFDRFDRPLLYSSHEQILGPDVEFDEPRATVRIEQNVPHLQLSMLATAYNCVNDAALWGMAERCIKLSGLTWEEKYYGSCEVYYVRTLEFDVDPNTFDRDVFNQGTKVIHGHWNRDSADADPVTGYGKWKPDNIAGAAPDHMNPTHFDRYKDRNGENARVPLTVTGRPALVKQSPGTGTASWDVGVDATGVSYRHVEKYDEYDFFLLGVPALLGT